MLFVPGSSSGKDLCDRHLGATRRDVLRVGGSGFLGLSLGTLLHLQSAQASEPDGRTGVPGWGRAKSIIMVYLQGGPSHLDLWDPKDDVPEKVASAFKTIDTKVPGVRVKETLPRLAEQTDKFTFIRSMSYTPVGLFNHTAAIYQMMTGYTTDKVSPSGQLEPPSPKDFPNFGSQIIRLKPPTVPMLPFVMLPRPLQESNVVGKGGTAGFLGKAYDPYTLYPEGDDMNMSKMDNIRVDDLQLRPEVFAQRLQRRRPAPRRPERRDAGDRRVRLVVQPERVLRPGPQPGRLRAGPRGVRPRAGEAAQPATATAGPPSAIAACWRGDWSRPAPGSSRSSGRRSPTATTTRGTTTST